jgi:hypothetical protein
MVWFLSAGIESFSKLGDSIYFEEKGEVPALYIIQFIPSTFNWRTAGLTVAQQPRPLRSSDQYIQVSFSVSVKVNLYEVIMPLLYLTENFDRPS